LIRSLYGVEKAGPYGFPGLLVPSSSIANNAFVEPPEKCVPRVPLWLPVDALSCLLRGESDGGGKGPDSEGVPLKELALRALAFSSRSALKKKSNGDSSRCGCVAILADGGVGESTPLEDDSFCVGRSLMPGESGTDLE
jgi:hypothetical protein